MNEVGQSTEPKTEIVKDPFTIELCIADAIRLIQKNERGRQGRFRMLLILQRLRAERHAIDNRRKLLEGLIKDKTNEEKENAAALFIQ
jgi:hypothetical protein